MMKRVGVIVLLAAFCALPAFAKESLPQAIVGSWKMRSFSYRDAAGKMVPWCTNPTGYLIYTAQKMVSASIQCAEISAEDKAKGYPSELFYAGTYEYKGGDLFTHNSSVDTNRANIGKPKERHLTLKNNDELTITGQGMKGPFTI